MIRMARDDPPLFEPEHEHAMAHDPLFNIEMPRWWERTAWLIRGLSLGFLLGYLFSTLISPAESGAGPIIVITASMVAALLPSVPKAWIEQRNRVRAARDGTLTDTIEKRRNAD